MALARMALAAALIGAASFSSLSVALAQTPPPAYSPPGASPPPPPSEAPPPPAPEPVAEKKLGVGYKIGNGIGFVGGDIIVAPIEHLAFDLQFNYLSYSTPDGTAKGLGLAPCVQGRLFGGQRSTPYVGLGFLHASLSLRNVTASGSGMVANLGYEWRWDSGLGILLGAGVQHLGTVSATDGVTTITEKGYTDFNIEAGLRFMFL